MLELAYVWKVSMSKFMGGMITQHGSGEQLHGFGRSLGPVFNRRLAN